MSMLVSRSSVLAIGVHVLALCPLPFAGCNGDPVATSGAQATEGTDDSSGPSATTSVASASGSEAGADTPGADDDTTVGGPTSSTSGASDTTDDTGPEPYPEACYEPAASIDVMSAMTPAGPLTIDEAWLGADFCSGRPYIVLRQYPTAEASGGEVTLMVQSYPRVDGPYLGIHPLALAWEERVAGTIDIVEPFEGELGERHLHGLIELQAAGWDLSLEVDLLDCGIAECFCPCR